METSSGSLVCFQGAYSSVCFLFALLEFLKEYALRERKLKRQSVYWPCRFQVVRRIGDTKHKIGTTGLGRRYKVLRRSIVVFFSHCCCIALVRHWFRSKYGMRVTLSRIAFDERGHPVPR